MQDLTSIRSSAFLQNHQMLKYKREKEKIVTVERSQAAHNYVDVSKSSKLQNMYSFHQWPISGEGRYPRF